MNRRSLACVVAAVVAYGGIVPISTAPGWLWPPEVVGAAFTILILLPLAAFLIRASMKDG